MEQKNEEDDCLKFIEESVHILEQARKLVLDKRGLSETDVPVRNNIVTNSVTSSLANEEFKRNFPGLSGRTNGKMMQTYLPSSTRSQSRRYSPFSTCHQRKILNTWTHEFVCLDKLKAIQTPSATELATLKQAGLGKQKVVFKNKNGDHKHIKETLEAYFPRLKSQKGAFQLARACMGGSGIRQLSYIPLSNRGYAVQELKEDVRASTVYIVPLNSNIDISPVTVNDVTPVLDGLLSKCITCNVDMPIWEFQEHKNKCTSKDTSYEKRSEMYEESAATTVTNVSKPSDNDFKQHILDIFPNAPDNVIDKASGKKDLSEAVDHLLKSIDGDDNIEDDVLLTSCWKRQKKEVPRNQSPVSFDNINDILRDYRTKLAEQTFILSVNRDEIWKDAMQFYKKCMKDKCLLLKKFEVQFSGLYGEDESSDAGAIRNEFFDLLLKEFLKRSFCENALKFVPRRGDSINFTLFGIVIGHSLLNGGPGIYCLHPYVYEMISGIDENERLLSLITKNDIPLNAATEKTIKFIESLDEVKNQDDLDVVVDSNIEIINSCQWETTAQITIENKGLLMTEIFLDILIRKRKSQVKSIREGLP